MFVAAEFAAAAVVAFVEVATAPDGATDVGSPAVTGVGDAGTGSVIPGFPNTKPLAPPDPNAPNAPAAGDAFKNGPLLASRACNIMKAQNDTQHPSSERDNKNNAYKSAAI